MRFCFFFATETRDFFSPRVIASKLPSIFKMSDTEAASLKKMFCVQSNVVFESADAIEDECEEFQA